MEWLKLLVLLLTLWCVVPFALVFCRVLNKDIPDEELGTIYSSLARATLHGLYKLPFSLVSPIVVPFALLFTKWEDDALPKLFRYWDNDVSLNGDLRLNGGWDLLPIPLEDSEELRKLCYWAPGEHPRSYKARCKWLLRNRCGYLGNKLGVAFVPDGLWDKWGNRQNHNDEGWTLYRYSKPDGSKDYIYNQNRYVKIGSYVVNFYTKYGFKVWDGANGRKYAPVAIVAIAAIAKKL